MKILYAIQATGNGHIIRARHNIPMLKEIADVDILQSGSLSDIDLGFDVKYKFNGLSFKYDSNGGISYIKTISDLNIPSLIRDVRNLDLNYDLVISDFEPISAWASSYKDILCIGSSHQYSFNSKKVPRPRERSCSGEFILKELAPASVGIGFHYKSYDNFIVEPTIRKELVDVNLMSDGSYVVYLSAYSKNQIYDVLRNFPQIKFYVFVKGQVKMEWESNVCFLPVGVELFTEKIIGCEGVITAGGFESTSECLYLGKKMLVIPIKGQYEQLCNCAALERDFDCHISSDLNVDSVRSLIEGNVVDRVHFKNDFNYVDKIMSLL
jgi:uncharacterized protein (TIGR00661 family)